MRLFGIQLWRSYDEKAQAVLDYLHHHGESYGLAICKGAGLSRGTCYLHYSRMEDQGLISSRYEAEEAVHPEIALRRRLYSITTTGQKRRMGLDTRPSANEMGITIGSA